MYDQYPRVRGRSGLAILGACVVGTVIAYLGPRTGNDKIPVVNGIPPELARNYEVSEVDIPTSGRVTRADIVKIYGIEVSEDGEIKIISALFDYEIDGSRGSGSALSRAYDSDSTKNTRAGTVTLEKND